jgi:hypothetical protein
MFAQITSRKFTVAITVLAATLWAVPRSCAQIMEERQYRGKKITCMLSGLMGWRRPCGIDGNYAYIFVGSVLSATEVSETEKRLQLTTQEIFLGDPASELTVTTNQGACLPEILPGDQWLFYLWRDDKTKELLLDYGSPSKPIVDAQPSITKLRRLAAMTDSGIVQGQVTRPIWHDDEKYLDYTYPPNHKVIAKRDSDGAEYSAVTDDDGQFEFEPLPSGSYHLSANTEKGLWAEDGPAKVHSRGCESFVLELHSDGEISGRVRSVDGKPFKVHPWIDIKSEGRGEVRTAYADERGNFDTRGLEPGRYVVALALRLSLTLPNGGIAFITLGLARRKEPR